MEVQLTQNCFVDGKACKVGDVVDTKHAWLLIGCGKATKDIKVKTKAKRSPANRMAEAENAR